MRTDIETLDALQRAPDVAAFEFTISGEMREHVLSDLYARYVRWFVGRFDRLPTRSWKSFAGELAARGYRVRVVDGVRRVCEVRS
jgi:hypothetical protein